MVYCGVSGWTHPSWHGAVYPLVRPRNFHPLEYLSQFFDFVEVDCSPGRPLRPERSRLWLKKTPERFRFTVQVGPPFVTDAPLPEREVETFKDGLWPLLRANRLGCLLLRFPWSFRFNRENRERFLAVRRAFHEFPMVAEMRHASWRLEEAIGTLIDYRVGFCNLDQPEGAKAMPPTALVTSAVGYVRLLGRAGDAWFEEEKAAGYLYTPPELGRWKARLDRFAPFTQDTYVTFANAPEGKAVVNALQMRALLADAVAAPRRRTERAAIPMPGRPSQGADVFRDAERLLA